MVDRIKVTIPTLLLLILFSSQTSALQCLDCQDVSDKRDCQKVVSCGIHQKCYTNRVIDTNGRNLYSLGCVDQYACSQLSQNSGLGKREINPHLAFSGSDQKRSLITLCFQCCNNSDGCNINVCGTAVNPCTKSHCVHGTCSDRGNNDFWCTCASGYIGRFCDLQISSPCSSSPCVHGSCVSQVNGYACTCDTGYAGKNCDLADPCSHSPCVHGVCTTFANNSFTCKCNSGYTGLLCDRGISGCIDSTPADTCRLAEAIVCQDRIHANNANCVHFCGYC